jgi:hypothetical protein
MTLVGKFFPVLCLLMLCTARAYAHREDYIDETLVFVTLERGEIESEYWFDIGRDDSQKFMRHNVALEYGFTDHWMADTRVTGLEEEGDGFHFDSSRLETRYRFYDEGTLPIDIAVSGEFNTQRDEDGHQIYGIEPRLIFSKDYDKLNLTLNFAEEIPFNRHNASLVTRGGWRYDAASFFRFGSELGYDTEQHALAVIPQIWFTLPHDVTLKAGYSYEFGSKHERFFRIALEVGF